MWYRHILMTVAPSRSLSSFVVRFILNQKRFTGENKRDRLTNTCGMRVWGERMMEGEVCFKLVVLLYTMPGIWVIAGGRPLSWLVSKTKGGIFGPTLKYCFVIQVVGVWGSVIAFVHTAGDIANRKHWVFLQYITFQTQEYKTIHYHNLIMGFKSGDKRREKNISRCYYNHRLKIHWRNYKNWSLRGSGIGG